MRLSARIRAALVLGTLISWAAVGPIPSAGAIEPITSSQITSPSDPTYVIYDETVDAPAAQAFTVQGTVGGATEGYLDLRCYTDTGEHTIVNGFPFKEGRFASPVVFENLKDVEACVLRAVPDGESELHPPGSESPFAGPRLLVSHFKVASSEGTQFTYLIEDYGLGGFFEISSASDCGLESSALLSADTLSFSETLFYCNADFYIDDPSTTPSSRAGIQVDGANAYGTWGAYGLAKRLKAPIEHPPALTVTNTFDPATGLATVHETDPIVKCSPSSSYPPTAESCREFVSTGVQLERTWRVSNAGLVAWMTDRWRSTDGAPHTLNALYSQETHTGPADSAYEFPGWSGFAAIGKGQLIGIPAGPGAIYYKEDAPIPDEGDGHHPHGAIVYDIAPSEQAVVYRSTERSEEYSGFDMPYTRTIPAGGAATLRMTFVQDYSLSAVQTLAGEALASYPPSLSIASPANGASVSTSSVTVTGTASDSGQLGSLTVNGAGVSVGASGAWSTTVALKAGANTITAVATDEAGLTATRSLSVTYAPPPPPPTPAHASKVGALKVGKGWVRFTIACEGEAGSCEIRSSLITTEKVKGKKITALAAKKRKIHSKKVTVGSAKVVIAAGDRQTITIKLNGTGKKLLAKFKKLPARLTVAMVSAGQKTTIISQRVKLTPAKKHKAKAKRAASTER